MILNIEQTILTEFPNQKPRNLFVALEGPIGVGKSTLTKRLAADLGYPEFKEPLDGPIQQLRTKFYKEPNKYAFALQMKLFMYRFRQHKLIWDLGVGAIQDRSIYGDKPFAYLQHDLGIMDDEQLAVYEDTWYVFKAHIVYPDVIIFLHAPVDILMQRIKYCRGRPEESHITEDYISKLSNRIDDLYTEMRNENVLCLQYNWADPDSMYPILLRQLRAEQGRPGYRWRHTR
jgi:deoxyadenosine/deoxycytidine kinase